MIRWLHTLGCTRNPGALFTIATLSFNALALIACQHGHSAVSSVKNAGIDQDRLWGDLFREGANEHLLLMRLRAVSEAPQLALIGAKSLMLPKSNGRRSKYPLHPQGMARDPRTGHFFVSAVEIQEQRSTNGDTNAGAGGKGHAYLFEFNEAWNWVKTLDINVDDEHFHPGGIDLFDDMLMVPVAKYVPQSSTTISMAALPTLLPWTFSPIVSDHLGFIVVHSKSGNWIAGSWNSATWYRYRRTGSQFHEIAKVPNLAPDRMAHQDGQSLGSDYVLLTGIVHGDEPKFGLDLVEISADAMTLKRTLRWPSEPYLTRQGRTPFHNATFAWANHEGRLFVAAIPDDQPGLYRSRPHRAGPDVGDQPETNQDEARVLIYEIK